MNPSLKTAAVVECVISCVTGVLALLTVVWPDWIERAFTVEPDGGSGLTEVAIVLLLALVTLAVGFQARRHWLRAARTE